MNSCFSRFFIMLLFVILSSTNSYSNSLDNKVFKCKSKKYCTFSHGDIFGGSSNRKIITIDMVNKTLSGYDFARVKNIIFKEGSIIGDIGFKSIDCYWITIMIKGEFFSRYVLFRKKVGTVHLLEYSDILTPLLQLSDCVEE